jgi:hypothetical protein
MFPSETPRAEVPEDRKPILRDMLAEAIEEVRLQRKPRPATSPMRLELPPATHCFGESDKNPIEAPDDVPVAADFHRVVISCNCTAHISEGFSSTRNCWSLRYVRSKAVAKRPG